jgi:molecular chaperone DnaJ
MSKDYYKILGVEKNASEDELKKAYRRLAHEHHPDKNGGDGQKFKEVNEAFQVLGDAQKRAQYDQFGSAAFDQGGFGAGNPAGGFGFDPGGFNVNFGDMGDLGDILGGMFGFGGRGARQRKGQDIQVDVEIEFLDAVRGVNKKIGLYKQDKCSGCAGNGAAADSKLNTCKTCNGQGRVERAQRTIFGTVQSFVACAECQGTGQVPEKPCAKCRGTGAEKRNQEIEINIPAGISDGDAIKVSGAGEYAGRGAHAGDLLVRIGVRPHPSFERQGNDIYSTVEAAYSMLTLGGKIDVQTVDGASSLKIPQATKPGTVFKLRGKGLPFMRSMGRGDHMITVQVKVEKKLSREQNDLVEKLRGLGL